jgi:hypothetical protein
MTTNTRTTTALILATFALVGIMTTGAVVPAAFAQTATDTALLDLLGDQTATDGNSDSNGITDEAETEEATTTQAEDQSEDNVQSNSIDQDQTGAINQEIGSGSGSEVASAAQSESESEYESKYKSKSKYGSTVPISGGTSTSTSDSASDVSNTGGLAQEQSLSSPVQVNTNTAGDDESRSAVVGFDLGFEQFTEEVIP